MAEIFDGNRTVAWFKEQHFRKMDPPAYTELATHSHLARHLELYTDRIQAIFEPIIKQHNFSRVASGPPEMLRILEKNIEEYKRYNSRLAEGGDLEEVLEDYWTAVSALEADARHVCE